MNAYGWLKPDEMIQGLALAETTPGPLIMVVQFVAFVGAFRSPGSLDPWLAATLGALITTWVTFVPGFLFVLLGAPSVEKLRGNERLSAALTGITAAVVGVIASLALYFAVHTFFTATAELHWVRCTCCCTSAQCHRLARRADRRAGQRVDLPAALAHTRRAGRVRGHRCSGAAPQSLARVRVPSRGPPRRPESSCQMKWSCPAGA